MAKAKVEKVEKVEKIFHPGITDEDKLKDVPADWDAKIHKPLKRMDFEHESVWFFMRADQLETKAGILRHLGEESKKFGSKKDQTKAKRLKKMQEKMAELQKELESQGIDVNALLADQD